MALIVKIGANMQNFDKQMNKLTKDVKAVGTKLQGAGMAMTAGVTVPLLAVGAAAVKTGIDFESSMSKVSAISGATGDDLATLEAKAREMGATTQFSAKEAADAFSFMAMAGWKTEDMLNGIDGIMSLAAASGEDLAMVSDIVTDSLTAFGMSAQDSGKFADILAAASSNANTNVSMLGESFKMVAPVAGAMGYSVEDTSKALSLMANAGIKGSESGTALRTMMTNLTKPTKQMQDAMDELGISITNSDGSMKSFDEVMLDLRGSFDGLEESQQAAYAATIFGKEAMAGALSVINASEADYNKLSGAINNAEGSAATMAATMNDNLAGRLKEMKSAFEEMGLVIYQNLQPALEKIVSAVKSLADWFNNLSPTMQTVIIALAGLVAAIGPILVIVGTGIILFGQMQAALAILGVSFGAIAGPIGIAIAAIAAIIVIGITLYKNWDTVKKKASSIWSSIKSIFSSVTSAIAGFIKKNFGDGVYKAVQSYMNMAKSIISSILGFWKNTFSNALAFIKALVTGDFEGMKNAISNQMNNILSTIKNIWSSVKSFFTSIDLFSIGADIIRGLIKGISSMAGALWDKAKSIAKGISDKISGALKIKSPSRVTLELGKFTGEGLALGIESMRRKIEQASTGMATAAIPQAGSDLVQKSGSPIRVSPLRSASKGTTGTGTTVNVYPKYANLNESQLMRVFKRQVMLHG
jgi:TP901 family phage tail tape measure protein